MNVVLFPFWLLWEGIKLAIGLVFLSVALPFLFFCACWEEFNRRYPYL